MKIKQTGVLHQPRIKADLTGTISVGTIQELMKGQFDQLNDVFYNKEEVIILVATRDEYFEMIREEAQGLVEANQEE